MTRRLRQTARRRSTAHPLVGERRDAPEKLLDPPLVAAAMEAQAPPGWTPAPSDQPPAPPPGPVAFAAHGHGEIRWDEPERQENDR